MVITSRMLVDRFGIDEEIADYFANKRPVPENNLYWGSRRIYISAGFGFLFIPIVFDLMYKLGVDKKDLLDEKRLNIMEALLHNSQLFELNKLSFSEYIQRCTTLTGENIKQKNLYDSLINHFSGKTVKIFDFELVHKALARGDSFLFTIVNLDVTDGWVNDFLPYWYGLMRPIFLFDDFKDLEEDKRNGDENTILELGGDSEAISKATKIALSDINTLKLVNEKLSNNMISFLNQALQYVELK